MMAGQRMRIAATISPCTYGCPRALAVSSPHAVSDLLTALAAVMRERGVQWYLFGAQAAIIWGSPRLSADVDVTALLEHAGLAGYIDTMREHWIRYRFRRSGFHRSHTSDSLRSSRQSDAARRRAFGAWSRRGVPSTGSFRRCGRDDDSGNQSRRSDRHKDPGRPTKRHRRHSRSDPRT